MACHSRSSFVRGLRDICILWTLFTLFLIVNVQAETTTTTLYETISNPETVTSFWGFCSAGWALPQCDQVVWSPNVISASNGTSSFIQTASATDIITGTASSPVPGSVTSGSGTGSLSPSSGLEPTTTDTGTATSSPSVIPTDAAFVLQGLNTSLYADLYVQFDDTNGRVILGDEGIARFVAFRLTSAGELVNAADATEFAYIRYDSSVATEYPQEETAITFNIRSVLHGNQADLVDSDFITVWSFDLTTGELGLVHDGRSYVLFLTPATTGRRRSVQSEAAGGELQERFISYNVYMLPADVPVPSDSVFQKLLLQVDNVSLLPSSDFPSPTPSVTSAESSSEMESTPETSITGSTTRRTSPTPTSDRRSSSRSGSNTSRRTTSDTSSRSLPDAYDIITIYHLEDYCTSLLSYFTQTVVESTTYQFTNTEYQPIFSDVATVWSSTEVVPRSTLTTGSPIPSAGPSRRQVIDGDPDTPSQLSEYATASIRSACSKAASRPSETFTDFQTTSTGLTTTVPTSITTTFSTKSIESVLTQTGTAIQTTYISGWSGYWILANSNPTDETGPYYGLYLGVQQDDRSPSHIKVTNDRSQARPFTAEYDSNFNTWTLNLSVGIGIDGRLVFSAACSPAAQANAADNRLDVIAVTEDRFPLYFQLDTTTFLATADSNNNFITGTFWYCPAEESLYYYDQALSLYSDLPLDCVDTGLNNLRGVAI
ncbi:hypothetical protein ABW21_db0202329 [Orbilia brochopaga]|nr:hypothetical protein ABW21_db0202329 [Drechslerella brochopaga]